MFLEAWQPVLWHSIVVSQSGCAAGYEAHEDVHNIPTYQLCHRKEQGRSASLCTHI